MALARPGAPTLEMVAARAGVSRATVSRVVNGSPKVSSDVASAVRVAIDELGYVPNRAARMLVSKQSHALALLVPEDMSHFFGDPYLASIVTGIHDRLAAEDYVLNLIVAATTPNEKTTRYLQGGNVDGALVVSHHSSDTFLPHLTDTLPVVFGGRPPFEAGGYVVDVDNIAGARRAVEHLVSIGRKRIAHIAGPSSMVASEERLHGYHSALATAGLTPGPIVDGDFTLRGGTEAMRKILTMDSSIDAVFVASDLMAAGAMTVLRAQGFSVPRDIAVVGYDDSIAATTADVPITTIRQPSRQMGAAMVDVLMSVLRGDPDVPRLTILPTDFVRRQSA